MDAIVRDVFLKRFPEKTAPSVTCDDDGVFEICFGEFTFRIGSERGTRSLFSFFTHADGLETAVGSGFNAFEAADFFYTDLPFRAQWENLSNEDLPLEINRVAHLIERMRQLGSDERQRLKYFIQGHQFGSGIRYRRSQQDQ